MLLLNRAAQNKAKSKRQFFGFISIEPTNNMV